MALQTRICFRLGYMGWLQAAAKQKNNAEQLFAVVVVVVQARSYGRQTCW